MGGDEIRILGVTIFGLIIALLFFAWLTVALRMWVRLSITKLPGWDDATMILTLVLFTCYCAFIMVIIGESASTKAFSKASVLRTLVYVQLSEIFYILTTTLLKISLGLFFLRLLTKPWQKILFYSILGVSAVYGFFYFLATVFVCGNPSHLGDSLLASKRCLPPSFTLATGYTYGVINVIADWIFTLVPIVILIESDMDRRAKVSVSLVMAFAAVGSISSIMRMVFLRGLLFRDGPTATTIKATIWATAEPGTGIIAASVAILRPLLRKVATGVRSRISSHGGSKYPGGDVSFVKRDADRESIIGLTPMGTQKDLDSMKDLSSDSDDAWDERMSMERTQSGISQAMTIHVAASTAVTAESKELPPLPLQPIRL